MTHRPPNNTPLQLRRPAAVVVSRLRSLKASVVPRRSRGTIVVRHLGALTVLLVLVLAVTGATAPEAQRPAGAVQVGIDVWRQRGFEPLAGKRSLAELVKLITETMPDEKPERCAGEEAEAVALYVFNEFYTPRANAPQAARIELSQLDPLVSSKELPTYNIRG